MAIKGNDGKMYRYDSENLIKKIKQLIRKNGDCNVVAWVKTTEKGVKFYTHYDIPEEAQALDFNELNRAKEVMKPTTAKKLLEKLKEQN